MARGRRKAELASTLPLDPPAATRTRLRPDPNAMSRRHERGLTLVTRSSPTHARAAIDVTATSLPVAAEGHGRASAAVAQRTTARA